MTTFFQTNNLLIKSNNIKNTNVSWTFLRLKSKSEMQTVKILAHIAAVKIDGLSNITRSKHVIVSLLWLAIASHTVACAWGSSPLHCCNTCARRWPALFATWLNLLSHDNCVECNSIYHRLFVYERNLNEKKIIDL